MKKISLILLSIVLSTQSFAGLYDLEIFQNQTESYAKEQFKDFAKAFSTGLNAGLGDVMNIGFVKVGVETTVVPFEKKGILSVSPISFLPIPFVYGGVSLFGITPFARITAIPVKSGGKYPLIIGGGLGYEIDVVPLLFTIQPAFVFHTVSGFDRLKVNSYAGHLQARVNLPLVTPFANLGVSYTQYKTEIPIIGGSNFSYSHTLFHGSLGVKVLFFFAEVAFVPSMSYTAGLSFGF